MIVGFQASEASPATAPEAPPACRPASAPLSPTHRGMLRRPLGLGHGFESCDARTSGVPSCWLRHGPPCGYVRTSPVLIVRTPRPFMVPLAHSPSYTPPCVRTVTIAPRSYTPPCIRTVTIAPRSYTPPCTWRPNLGEDVHAAAVLEVAAPLALIARPAGIAARQNAFTVRPLGR
jgi:hypothetical protein